MMLETILILKGLILKEDPGSQENVFGVKGFVQLELLRNATFSVWKYLKVYKELLNYRAE